MAEAAGDGSRRHISSGDELRGHEVPDRVEVQLGHFQVVAELAIRPKNLDSRSGGTGMRPSRFGENTNPSSATRVAPASTRASTPPAVLGEQGDASVAKGQGALLMCLGAHLQDAAGYREQQSGDAEGRGIEVDAAPSEGARLAAAGAGDGGQHDRHSKDRGRALRRG